MLRLANEKLHQEVKLCIFVDGLDEFGGCLDDLIRLFQDLKICVSSRPWVQFEDAFKSRPSLMLQDLVYNDIKKYVANHLSSDTGCEKLRSREPAYAAQLIENIVAKACGVFL